MTRLAYQNIEQATDLMIRVNGKPLLIDYRQLETLSDPGELTCAESSYCIGGLPHA